MNIEKQLEIAKELDEQVKEINQNMEYYRNELDFNDNQKDKTTAELVREADLDNVDFNIGFEQGYMRGLEMALSIIKNK